MERFDQRQGFLISALVHSVIIMSLASRPYFFARKPAEAPATPAAPEVSRRVFMPPPEVLRQLAPRPLPPPPQARPQATPPPPVERGKDRISIGPPVAVRQKEPLILRREDDLTKAPKGLPNAVPTPQPTPPPVSESQAGRVAGSEIPGAPGLRRPLGATEAPRGEDGRRGAPGTQQPSIASSLKNFEQRLQTTQSGPLGIVSGTGQQMGAFFFDPQGADFTAWLNHFKNEVYRNWILPQPALMGFRGHVDLEFTVARDGSVTSVRLLKTSGTNSLDRAAQNALQASQALHLPSDFSPASVTMQVTFYYNEGSERS